MTQEQILPKKPLEKFLESDTYQKLKKEVTEVVANVRLEVNEENIQDAAPVLDYFEKEAQRSGLSESQAEKLFWQTVAEEIKETVFRDTYEEISKEIEDEDYSEARTILTWELNLFLEQLSHTIYANLSRKSVAIMVLKEKFYKLFPEIETLIEETDEERRAKIKVQTKKQESEKEEDEKWEKEKGKYLVEELKWPVPKGNELVSGLLIFLFDQEQDRTETIELLGLPYFEDGDLFVKVKWNGIKGNIRLADFGLAANAETGLWNSRYKPLTWEIKDKI